MAGQSRKIDTNAVKQAITQLQQLFGAGKVLPTNVMPDNPALNTALNAAAYLPNKIYGEGIVAPTNDATRNAINLLHGQQPVPYDQLQSGATKLGYQAGAAINPMQGVPSDVGEGVSNAIDGATPAFTAQLLASITAGLENVASQGKGLVDAYKDAGVQASRPPNFENMTIGQLQEWHQAQSGLTPLAKLDQAMRAKDYRGVLDAAGKILTAKDGPLVQYQNSLRQYTEPAYKILSGK